jgi:dTDP-4-amino-4,6-dideoxygalactose transaminase
MQHLAAKEAIVDIRPRNKEKLRLDDLALFGGDPSFQEKLHVGRPNIGNREILMDRINQLLDDKWLTNDGPFVKEFEQKISKYLGVKHSILMCNGTIALEIAIRALGLSGEVIVPSFTFIATAHALQWQEITPVFCDIRRNFHTIDPAQVERMITPRTSGIIGVHLWGNPCEIDYLTDICKKNGLKLLFDSSHAFGCSYNGTKIGAFGEAEIFSFHATKFLNTFEGGAIVTNNDELADKIRLMKNFGFSGFDKVIYIGTNGKMSEISAAMGLTGLENIDDFIKTNKRNYEIYEEELSGLPCIELMSYNCNEQSNYQYIVITLNNNFTTVSRDLLIEILHSENIIARRYFYPGCHRMEPYRSFFPHAGLLLPNTEKIAEQVMILPNGTALQEKDVRKICEVIKFVISNEFEIGKEWRKHKGVFLK